MFSFITGIIIGFFSGSIFGYVLPYFINIYKRYKVNNDKQKAIAEEIFSI